MYMYAYLRPYIRCIGRKWLYIRKILGVHENAYMPNPESDPTVFWLNSANRKTVQALTFAHAARARQASHKMH